MRNIYWFSTFMSWFFIIIIFVVTWNWLILFGIQIIWLIGRRLPLPSMLSFFVCVLSCWIYSSISWVTLLVLGLYYLLDNIFGLFYKGVVLPDCKTVLFFLWCDNITFEWFSYNGKCWVIILPIRLNANCSMLMLRHC